MSTMQNTTESAGGITYDNWLEQLKVIAKERYGYTDEGQTDWHAFKVYFDGGYTPAEAMAEDSSYE